MAKTIKEERLRWIVPIWKKEVKLVEVVKVCPHSKRSLERWLAQYRKYGAWALEPKSTEPKTQPNETPIWIKERIIEVRKKTKKCALKIHWQLKKEDLVVLCYANNPCCTSVVDLNEKQQKLEVDINKGIWILNQETARRFSANIKI